MNRRNFIVHGTTFLFGTALGAGFVAAVSRYTPDFYAQTLHEEARVAPAQRRLEARQLERQTRTWVEALPHVESWSVGFTQTQVNSWLIEELPRQFPELQQAGAHDPRVRFADGYVLLGIRIERPEWSGVISLRLRPFVPERNQIAVAVEAAHAGRLPLPGSTVVRELSPWLEPTGWTLSQRRLQGRDVLIAVPPAGAKWAAVLRRIEVVNGALRVFGDRSHAPSQTVTAQTSGDKRHEEMN